MTKVECTKCGDLILTTADTIVDPFVCMSCEQKAKEFEQMCESNGEFATLDLDAITQFYEDMKPKSSLPRTVEVEPEELTDEFATVENTTALISDLENQLTREKRATDRLVDEVEKLQKQVAEERRARGALNEEKARQANTIREYREANERLEPRVEELERENDILRQDHHDRMVQITSLKDQLDQALCIFWSLFEIGDFCIDETEKHNGK